MVRGLFGFVIGAVLWMVAFFALTFLVAFVWPAYAEHGQTWAETRVFTFEPPMAVVLLGGKLAGGFARPALLPSAGSA